jgi:hypothetical protein
MGESSFESGWRAKKPRKREENWEEQGPVGSGRWDRSDLAAGLHPADLLLDLLDGQPAEPLVTVARVVTMARTVEVKEPKRVRGLDATPCLAANGVDPDAARALIVRTFGARP